MVILYAYLRIGAKNHLFCKTIRKCIILRQNLHSAMSDRLQRICVSAYWGKYTCCAWAGGTFFQQCCCVSFWLWREKVLGVTYLPYQLCRCVFFLVVGGNNFGLHRSVFWLWWEIVLSITYLSTIPVVPLCQFFGCGGKQFLVAQFLRKILIWYL